MGNQNLSVHHIVSFIPELLYFWGRGALDLNFDALLNDLLLRLMHF